MDFKKYMNLSIPRARYEKLIKEWEKLVKPHTNLTFTVWTAETLESMIIRYKFLEKAYPNLRLISTTNEAFVIEDSSTNIIAKVWLNEGKLDCTAQDKERFIIFAALHPLYNLR